jgi:hypothetical protein
MNSTNTPDWFYRSEDDFINEIKMSDPSYTSKWMAQSENSD